MAKKRSRRALEGNELLHCGSEMRWSSFVFALLHCHCRCRCLVPARGNRFLTFCFVGCLTLLISSTSTSASIVVAQAQGFTGGDTSDSGWEYDVMDADVVVPIDSLSFDLGGSRPRCWNATGRVSNVFYPAHPTTFKDCMETMQLTVEVGKSSGIKSTEQGWEVEVNQKLHISITGTWMVESHSESESETKSSNYQTAIVVQLCPVGFQSRCTPFVPPFSDDSRVSSTTSGAISTPYFATEMDSLRNPFNFEFISILPNGTFAGELPLSAVLPGTYSLLGSLMALGPNLALEGASIVPMSVSKEQLITFSNKQVRLQKETSPATVEHWAVNMVIALSTIGGTIVLVLLIATIHYCNAQVFELTQGKFIIAMMLCGLVATCSLVLLEPKNDLYCHLYQPMITLPMHIMFAILVGRMWRIRAIISPLLLLTLDKKEHWTTKWVNLVERMTRIEDLGKHVQPREKKIRVSITDGQLMRVIGMLSIPQVIVQILILTIQDQDYNIDTYPDGGGEYLTCKDTHFNNALGILALTLLLLLFVILMVLARASRGLPSLFNETRSMLDVALVAFRMTFAGALLIAATHTYPSAITAQYLVIASLGGVTVVHTCIRITWPKLIVAYSGNKIVVTKLIAAHNELARSQSHSITSSSAPPYLDPYFKNSFYGGSMLTGISIPKTPDHSGVISSLTGQSIIPSALLESQATPRSSDGIQKGNLETLEEDERESSDNSQGHVDDENQHDETILKMGGETGGDGENDDDLHSSASSVIITEDINDTSHDTRGQSFYSTETIDLTRHFRSSQAFSNRNINHSTPGETNTAASRSSAQSTSSFSFARTNSEVNLSIDCQIKYTRVLSRRAMLLRQPSAAQVADIENNPPIAQPPEPTMTGPIDSLMPQSDQNTENPRIRQRQHRVKGSTGRERINHAGQKMRSFFAGTTGGVVKSEMPRRSKSNAERNQSMIPLTIEYNPKRLSDTILVAENQPPPRRLLLRMIDVQRMLSKVNQAILTGSSVKLDDWEEIREACVALGGVFVREVEFDWERYRDDEFCTQSINESGEINKNENIPPDSAVAAHSRIANNNRPGERELAKQISWKPGLVGSTSDPHLEGNDIRPSILRKRETKTLAVETMVESNTPGGEDSKDSLLKKELRRSKDAITELTSAKNTMSHAVASVEDPEIPSPSKSDPTKAHGIDNTVS